MKDRNIYWFIPSLSAAALVACSAGSGSGTRDADFFFPDAGTPQVDASRTGPGAGDAGGTVPEGDCATTDLCGDGLNNDCDDAVDEGCPCVPGEVSACFLGPISARGVGACSDGMMVCEQGLEFGTWGACEGDASPQPEVCDADGVDENCDGAVNEGCECDPGAPPEACGSDVGECSPGTQECIDGRLAECMGGQGPIAESCNGLDDDCDGATDEGITRACGTDVGACRTGVETCTDGRFEGCVGSIAPVDELCDGADNDCDGSVDETLMRACGSSVGECTAGTQRCEEAEWSRCDGETLPSLESCNGLDDDCDAETDEGVTRGCGSSVGTCSPGTEVCMEGEFSACTGGTGPTDEVCDDRNDEDCDGTVDEGCACTDGETRPCGTDVGECVAGVQTCTLGDWGGCEGAVSGTVEECNMLDDDCDGMVDEMGVCPTAPPIVACPADISADVLSTVGLSGSGSDPDGGTVEFEWTVTVRPLGSTSDPQSPTSASTNFYLDASGDYVLQLCVTDDEMESACCTTNVTSIAPGALHVELSWDQPYGDVDLHLLNVTRSDPDGWFTSDDCFFGNRSPDWGPAGGEANPTLDIDDRDGYGPENITIDNMPAAGTYAVGIHHYCSSSAGGEGPLQGTVRIYCDGALIAAYTGLDLDGTDEWRTVATVEYPRCRARSASRSTTGYAILPDTLTNPVHCEMPCTSDGDCPREYTCRPVIGGGGRRSICLP